MVDDQFGGEERIDALGIAAHALHGFAHGGEIDDRGNAGEILQQNARGHEGNFFFRSAGPPACQRANVFGMNETAVFAAQQIFEQNAQGKGQLGEVGEALFFKKFQAVNFEGLRADVQLVACAEGIARVRWPFSLSFHCDTQPSMITEIESGRRAAILVAA